MRLGSFVRGLVGVFMGAAMLLSPVLYADGQLWIIATAATITVYYGITSRVVYAMTGILFVTETVYGGDVGSTTIAYIAAVIAALFVRRFIAMPAWASHDGWRLSDAVRTVILAWCICMTTVALSILIGDALYGYGRPWARIAGLASARSMLQPLIVAVLASVVIRRMAIPFRRAILFGI